MTKKTDRQTRPLAEYWMPPQDVIAGKPVACLATTYEFDASLFENELLPRFLGLKFDHTENAPTFRLELEDALRAIPVSVLVDASRFDCKQSTLSWDQIPIAVPGGIQHAKIVVLAWEGMVRVILGSANLTPFGYRRNRELFASLDFWDDANSTPTSVLADVLNLLELIPAWSRAVPAAVERCRGTVELVRGYIGRWKQATKGFKPRERPRVQLVATHPKINGRSARSSLGEMIKLWGDRSAEQITVVTPFVSPKTDHNTDVVGKLYSLQRTHTCGGWLVVPSKSATESGHSTGIALSESFKTAWQNAFSGSRAAWVLPIPEFVKGVDKANRTLHAKAVLIEGNHDESLLIGSSNFTPRGMGVGKLNYNIEVNLVFEDRDSAGRRDGGLGDRLGLPVPWDDKLPLGKTVWKESDKAQTDELSGKALPPFFAWASFSETTGELRVQLDRNEPEPIAWSITVAGSSEGKELFRREGPTETSRDELPMTFDEDSRPVPLVALRVKWTSADSQHCSALLAVSVQDRQKDLRPPPQLRELSSDAILDCLISGLSPAEWYDRQQRRKKKTPTNDAASDSLRAVDTSGYLLYRVRRFGRALAGMAERIESTALLQHAIEYRLFNDPFGPIPLANRIAAHESKEFCGWLSDMDREHRTFLIAEILLAVSELRSQMKPPRTVRREERDALQLFEKAIAQLDQLLSLTIDGVAAGKLNQYVSNVRTRANIVTQDNEESTNVR